MRRLSHTLSRAIVTAGLLSLSAGVFAQPPGPLPSGPGAQGTKAPATRAELQTRLENRFDRMDANRDGRIDEKDRQARRDQRIADLFARVDSDGNGTISKAEFAAAQADRADPPRSHPPRAGHMGRPGRAMMVQRGAFAGERLRGPLPFAPPPGRPMAGERDRKALAPLTRSDFVARGLARFDAADTNRDGTISTAERDARGALRGERLSPGPLAPSQPRSPLSPRPGQ